MAEIREVIHREVNVWHLLLGGAPLVAALIGAWVTLSSKMESVEARLNSQKEQYIYERAVMREDVKELKDDIKEIKRLLLEDQKQQHRQ